MIGRSSALRRAVPLIASLLFAGAAAAAPGCAGTLHLTLFTSNMSQAETIARILAAHDVKATLFLASGGTGGGDHALGRGWGE